MKAQKKDAVAVRDPQDRIVAKIAECAEEITIIVFRCETCGEKRVEVDTSAYMGAVNVFREGWATKASSLRCADCIDEP